MLHILLMTREPFIQVAGLPGVYKRSKTLVAAGNREKRMRQHAGASHFGLPVVAWG